MKILIVHDREEVSDKIRQSIETSPGGNKTLVESVTNCTAARERLTHDYYDVAIIDLTLPHSASTKTLGYSNAELLITDIIDGILHTPGDLVGISQDAGAIDLISSSIICKLLKVLTEDTQGKWLKDLQGTINYVRQSGNARYAVARQAFDYDAVLVTALDEELAPFRKIYEFSDAQDFPGALEFGFRDKANKLRRGIAYSVGRSGQHASTSFTQSLITRFRPKLCLMSGICGGVRKKVKLGDVVFFEAVFNWDSGKWEDGEEHGKDHPWFRPRVEPISIREYPIHLVVRDIVREGISGLSEEAQKLTKKNISKWQFRLASTASGSAVVADAGIVDDVRMINEDIRAVDMEAYGFYLAAKFTSVVKPNFL